MIVPPIVVDDMVVLLHLVSPMRGYRWYARRGRSRLSESDGLISTCSPDIPEMALANV
jgi:hypothetical protein